MTPEHGNRVPAGWTGRTPARVRRAACVMLLAAGIFIFLWASSGDSSRAGARPPAAAARTLSGGVTPARWFSARGEGALTVEGPGCCEGVQFPANFVMDYELDPAGRVRITRLDAAVADVDVAFNFLIFETARVRVRCGAAANTGVIDGDLDSAGNLWIAPGAANLDGTSFDKRDGDKCVGGNTQVSLTNNNPVTGVFDPAGNRLSLSGVFSTSTDGHTYNVRLEVAGVYTNRPPTAVFGVEGPGLAAFAQGGCPAVWRPGNPPEFVAEANDPAGLRMYLRSFSYDPEGSWRGADLSLDQWFHGRDAEPLKYVGEGRRRGPLTFEFGPVHRLTLKTSDRVGASATSDCSFRVVDTTPPAVTPPKDLTITPTVPGGATPATSPALKKFLETAVALDAADVSPSRLPPLLNGKEVTEQTVFPLDPSDPPDVWTPVVFRFRDKAGNVGTAKASVRVAEPRK